MSDMSAGKCDVRNKRTSWNRPGAMAGCRPENLGTSAFETKTAASRSKTKRSSDILMFLAAHNKAFTALVTIMCLLSWWPNLVRTSLVSNLVDSNRVFRTSYGKTGFARNFEAWNFPLTLNRLLAPIGFGTLLAFIYIVLYIWKP